MPSVPELLIVLLIVALLFGTRKLRSMGGDLGSAIKSFRSAAREDGQEDSTENGSSTSASEPSAGAQSSREPPAA